MNAESATAPAAPSTLPRLARASAALVFMLLVLSAYLRLRAAGLGDADWPASYGRWPPLAAPWWAAAAHRALATVLGVLIVAMVLTAWWRGTSRERLVTLALLVLTLALAALGLQTPAPTRPWVTLGHVLGAMAMLALLVLLAAAAAPSSRPARHARALRPWAALALALLFVQIALGAWLSANFAATACSALPGCGADWWASARGDAFDPTRELAIVEGAIRPGAASAFLHMIHRLAAVGVVLCLGILGVLAWRQPLARRSAAALLVLLVLQTALGIVLVALGLPLLLAVAHNAGAAALLMAALHCYSRVP